MTRFYVFAIFLLFLPHTNANSNTIVVGSSEDNYFKNVRGCTLRDAITAANTDTEIGACNSGSGTDEIVFDQRINGAIHLDTILPPIESPLQITGPSDQSDSIIIDGGQATRLLEIRGHPTTISNLTLKNGAAFTPTGGEGGAVKVLGGFGTVEFINVRFHHNIATKIGGAVSANRITQTIKFINCEFLGNSVISQLNTNGGGAIFYSPFSVLGMPISELFISGTTFEDNRAIRLPESQDDPNGKSPPTTLTNEPSGGAVFIQTDGLSNFRLTVDKSTFWANKADHDGGAISLKRTLPLTPASPSPSLSIYNSTLVNNSADVNQNDFGEGGGINTDFQLKLRNSVVANNSAALSTQTPNLKGLVRSTGFNFIGSATPQTGFSNTDTVHPINAPVDPGLGNLTDNGGFTRTAIPQFGAQLTTSPLLDQGKCFTSRDRTDQRGERRPVDITSIPDHPLGNSCDIGAVEATDIN